MDRILFPIILVALTLGGGIFLVLLLSHQRSRRVILLDLALTQAGATLLVLNDAIDSYGRILGGYRWPGMAPVSASLLAAGCGLVGYAIMVFGYHVTELEANRRRVAGPIVVGVAFTAAGAGSVLGGFAAGPAILVGLVQLYASATILLYHRRIPTPDREALVLPLLFLVAAVVLIDAVFSLLLVLGRVPPVIADPALVPLVSYLAISGVLLRYAVKVLFLPSGPVTPAVSRSFVSRFGISPREAEIIGMILKGHSNRTIGVQLYISDRTVKNHVYSIYRKTGVANKIQLLNLVGGSFDAE